MALEKLVFHDEAALELLKSPEVMADLRQRASRIAAAAGEGKYDVTDGYTPTRARVSVGTADHKARAAEATHRSLTRALDAGRG